MNRYRKFLRPSKQRQSGPAVIKAHAMNLRAEQQDEALLREALDEMDPFISAPEYTVCDGCDKFVELAADGFDLDHICRAA